jgi:hypothetical protein
MSKHSPGPWRFEPHSVDSNYMLIYCSNTPGEGDHVRGYCGAANARLIAAAPDLLQALQELLNANPGTENKWTLAANAAIAKATGEQA